MNYKRIYLDPSDEELWLDVYVSHDTTENRKPRSAVLIFPGGGYHGVSPREAEPVALAFLARGINAFVLNYRTCPPSYVYPRQLLDASMGILHIRQNAEEYGIDPTRVAVVGFSAGGHLAGALALMHNEAEIIDTLAIEEGSNRPDAAVLCYPVVTAYPPTHEGSFKNLLNKPFEELTDAERKKHSLECRVNENSPPMFIWHTATDKGVPARGSLLLAEKYLEYGLPVTLRLYPTGPHGLSLANRLTSGSPAHENPIAARWVDETVEFLEIIFKR